MQTIQKLAVIFPSVRRYQQFQGSQMALKTVYRLNIHLTSPTKATYDRSRRQNVVHLRI